MKPIISGRWRRAVEPDATPASEPVPSRSEEIASVAVPKVSRPALIDEKVKLHAKIIDEFNLALLDKIPADELNRHVRNFVSEYVKTERIPLNQTEFETFADEVFDEMVGLGPIEPLLKDPTISDILINSHESVYVERGGQLEPTTVRFKDEAHLLRIVTKIVAKVGRRVDESSPMVDARLPDGSRVNAAIRPVAVDGPQVSIRKFSKRPFSMDRLIEVGALRPSIAEVLKAAVHGRVSMIVSGGTGSGKTTMLNVLSTFISPKERLITIEDAAELQLQQHHVSRLETRPPNAEGKGEIRQRELVKNALRMRPDRIIIGEVRGEEAFDMLQAMNTGHEGSMTTIHANTPRDAIRRLEQMVGMSGLPMSLNSIRTQIASAIQVVIQLQRLSDGTRRMVSLSEVTGMEGDVVQMQEIFRFAREGVDSNGTVLGSFRATGIRPKFCTDLKLRGVDFSASYFDPTVAL
ncbi:CpaF family protein [Methylobacterium nodulans]|uniref:Type II secretion system protein E n=1 Tax=Methylobacterium nodulans (strain LMG 21967 / CNCM I-2342 / ORS 2060) TaxID=460265 RepID=B8IDY7_METNO|nr:type II secretion system protein E [Methylobacterium nodulans ORS 2060]